MEPPTKEPLTNDIPKVPTLYVIVLNHFISRVFSSLKEENASDLPTAISSILELIASIPLHVSAFDDRKDPRERRPGNWIQYNVWRQFSFGCMWKG